MVPLATRRLTRSNFFPSGLREVISKISSKSMTREEVAMLLLLVMIVCLCKEEEDGTVEMSKSANTRLRRRF